MSCSYDLGFLYEKYKSKTYCVVEYETNNIVAFVWIADEKYRKPVERFLNGPGLILQTFSRKRKSKIINHFLGKSVVTTSCDQLLFGCIRSNIESKNEHRKF